MFSQLPNINYNKGLGPITNIRVNDLYIDGNVYPPFSGPTGPTGSSSSFADQGFSVELNGDSTIVSSVSLVPFNNFNVFNGGYNPLNWYNTSTNTAIIYYAGTYIISATVGYIHNFNVGNETVTLQIRRNGLGGQILIVSNLFYGTPSNDNESLICTNIVNLFPGDTLQVYLYVPFANDGNQLISTLSKFSCQRIA